MWIFENSIPMSARAAEASTEGVSIYQHDPKGRVAANPAWIRKMGALVQEFSDIFRIKRWTEISKTYEMSKKYIRIGKPRGLSPAQRENLEKMRV